MKRKIKTGDLWQYADRIYRIGGISEDRKECELYLPHNDTPVSTAYPVSWIENPGFGPKQWILVESKKVFTDKEYEEIFV